MKPGLAGPWAITSFSVNTRRVRYAFLDLCGLGGFLCVSWEVFSLIIYKKSNVEIA